MCARVECGLSKRGSDVSGAAMMAELRQRRAPVDRRDGGSSPSKAASAPANGGSSRPAAPDHARLLASITTLYVVLVSSIAAQLIAWASRARLARSNTPTAPTSPPPRGLGMGTPSCCCVPPLCTPPAVKLLSAPNMQYLTVKAFGRVPEPLAASAPPDLFSEGRALAHNAHLTIDIGHRQVCCCCCSCAGAKLLPLALCRGSCHCHEGWGADSRRCCEASQARSSRWVAQPYPGRCGAVSCCCPADPAGRCHRLAPRVRRLQRSTCSARSPSWQSRQPRTGQTFWLRQQGSRWAVRRAGRHGTE